MSDETPAPPPDIPYRFDRTHQAAEVVEGWSALTDGEESGATVAVAGRIMLSRPQGRLAFAELRDNSGSIQLFAGAKWTARFEEFAKLSLGDWIGAKGEVVRTQRGELSVKVAEWELLAEARRNFGDKWRGVSDTENAVPAALRRPVGKRAQPADPAAAQRRGAPPAQPAVGAGFRRGGDAAAAPDRRRRHGTPFVTHHNALDTDFYLRVAPELFLKRLVVGGLDKVFEIGRVFRNEGLSPRHNPEFTILELYQAYADYRDTMVLFEELVAGLAMDTLGTTQLTYGGRPLDLTTPWRRAHGRADRRGDGAQHRRADAPRRVGEGGDGGRDRGRRGVGAGEDLVGDLREDDGARTCGARCSSSTIPRRCRRWHVGTATGPSSSSVTSRSWRVVSWATASPS